MRGFKNYVKDVRQIALNAKENILKVRNDCNAYSGEVYANRKKIL